MNKHTPGPWKVVDAIGEGPDVFAIDQQDPRKPYVANYLKKEDAEHIVACVNAVGDQSLHLVELATAHRDAVMNWESTLGRLTGGVFDQPTGLELLFTTWRIELEVIRAAINADPEETGDEVERLVAKYQKAVKDLAETRKALAKLEYDVRNGNPCDEALELAHQITRRLS